MARPAKRTVVFQVPMPMYELLAERAEEMALPVSWVVREAIRRYFLEKPQA